MVAFAIFWISFASIIQFHISKIHGTDLTSAIEFVKSADQKSLNKDPKVFYKPDLNTGSWMIEEKGSFALFNLVQKTMVLRSSEAISHICIDLHSLRGPPSI